MFCTLDLPVAVLPVYDYDRLQALAQLLFEQMHPLAASLSRKLSRSEWSEPDGVPEQTVLLDRFVTYRIEGSEQSKPRLLIDPADEMWPPAELHVTTPLGITLLGLSVGDRLPMIGADVRERPWAEVVAVGPMATRGIARWLAPSYGMSNRSSLADHRRWPKNGRRLEGKGE